MLRSAALILTGNAAGAVLGLARNLIVARMISVEHFGIAATFAIAIAVAEMMSNLGLHQQIVQSRAGDDRRFQAAVQGFSVLRGALAATALFLLAAPIAAFLNLPDLVWAFQLLALVPLMNGFVHFDIHRLTRQMRFRPLILTGVLPPLGAVLVLWPLSAWVDDYRLMLGSILTQAALTVLTSQIAGQIPYRLSLDRARIRESLAFGWPLLVNGLLMFGVFQGDKLLVGRALGMEALALFAMGVTLTLTPTLLMAKSAQNFFLPQLSAQFRADPPDAAARHGLSRAVVQVGLLNGTFLVLGIVLLGPPLVALLLGAKYAALVPLLTWLAILQAVRVFKSGSTVVALAAGQTSNAMLSNALRVLSLPLVWAALVAGADLLTVIAIGILAEAAGFAVSLLLVTRRLGVDLSGTGPAILLGLAVLAIAALGAAMPGVVPQYVVWLALIVTFALLVARMTDLRLYLKRGGVV